MAATSLSIDATSCASDPSSSTVFKFWSSYRVSQHADHFCEALEAYRGGRFPSGLGRVLHLFGQMNQVSLALRDGGETFLSLVEVMNSLISLRRVCSWAVKAPTPLA
jgi:hypothetical protein